MKNTVEITIDHDGGNELYEKLEAMQILMGTLTHEEIMFLSTTIKEKPEILAKLRPLLSKDDMSLLEMYKYAKEFYKMFKDKDPE